MHDQSIKGDSSLSYPLKNSTILFQILISGANIDLLAAHKPCPKANHGYVLLSVYRYIFSQWLPMHDSWTLAPLQHGNTSPTLECLSISG